jgi:transcription elongation factor Elf1
MTDHLPMRVFFTCMFCGALHSATQVRQRVTGSGRFDCNACNRTLHRWWAVYDFIDWSGPLDP